MKAPLLPEALLAEARTVPRWKRNPFRALLQARFPQAFASFGDKRKRPLKLDTYFDIRERVPELTGKQVHAGLADYTGGPTYQRACVAGAERIDLDGNPAGIVTEEQAAFHARKLQELQERFSREAMEHADPEYHGADADALE